MFPHVIAFLRRFFAGLRVPTVFFFRPRPTRCFRFLDAMSRSLARFRAGERATTQAELWPAQ